MLTTFVDNICVKFELFVSVLDLVLIYRSVLLQQLPLIGFKNSGINLKKIRTFKWVLLT